MNSLEENQTIIQHIVAFILTLFSAIYTIVLLTDAFMVQDIIKVVFLSLGLIVLGAVDYFFAYQIVGSLRSRKKEMEDS